MAENCRQVLFDGHYGTDNPRAINTDVDLFEEFYVAEFGDELKDIFINRMKSAYIKGGVAAIAVSFFFYIPMYLTPESIIAKLIAVMGVMVLGAGCFLLYRGVRAKQIVEKKLEDKIEAEFSATRTVLKRVFDYTFYEDGVFVQFGVKGKTRQKRSKLYADLSAVYETDQILFMKGLTWVSRFQIGDERFAQIRDVLRRECSDCYYVTGFEHSEKALSKISEIQNDRELSTNVAQYEEEVERG